MGNVKLNEFDIAQLLKTDEDMAVYLDSFIENPEVDAAHVAKELGTILRAKSMNQLARDTGIRLEDLYKVLSGDGDVKLSTVLKVTRALGLQLGVFRPTVRG